MGGREGVSINVRHPIATTPTPPTEPAMPPSKSLPTVVDRICAEVVKRHRVLDQLDPTDVQLQSFRQELNGEMVGLRVALCVMHGWDPTVEAHKERKADELVVAWWERNHPEEWTDQTPPVPGAPRTWSQGVIPADVNMVIGDRTRDLWFRRHVTRDTRTEGWWTPSRGIVAEVTMIAHEGSVTEAAE